MRKMHPISDHVLKPLVQVPKSRHQHRAEATTALASLNHETGTQLR